MNVGAGATISTNNNNAISVGSNAQITIDGTVTNIANNGGGSGTFGMGNNSIEFLNNTTLTISETGRVIATGSSGNSEAINPAGFGNSIINRGLIQATNSNAIWFEDQVTGSKNVIDNYGTIERVGGGSVMGSTRGAGITFYNRTGAQIIGSLSFGAGGDDLIFEAGSSVTGSINGGGGTNNLTLQGAAGNNDVLSGNITNFSTLTKDGEGKWTLPGSLSGFTIVTVNDGTLALTGNNSNYTGNLIINPDGTLEARAQSLPTKVPASSNLNNVQNDGLLRFVQTDDGAYVGQITGTGAVEKTGSGVLTLAPSVGAGNLFSGGLLFKEGTVAVGADNALGAAGGSLTFDGGVLRLTDSFDIGAARAITLDAGGGTIDMVAGVTSTLSQVMTGSGALTKDGAGTLILTGQNAFAGGTSIANGTLQLGDGGTSGSVLGDIANDGVLSFNRSDDVTFGNVISGSGSVEQNGSGKTIFTAANSYSGGTTISAGVLQLGNGGASGSITGEILNNASLIVDRSDTYALGGEISGSGTFDQNGTGVTVLTGANSYAGATNVNAGTLIVNGDQSAATGMTTVQSGATLGGMGLIGGDVVVDNGGTINPGDVGAAPGALGIGGNLNLAAGSILDFNFGQANVAGGALNDLIDVGGDLVLDGTLNVQTTAGGSFDPGVYRVINYGGALTNNGLTLGTIPSPDFYVQTSVPGQVNLVNTTGVTLRYWDGATIPSKNNDLIDGGDGLWQNFSGNDNWTDQAGDLNAPFSDGAFAVFMGAAGNVTVDESLGAINASGMQFLTDGYEIAGDKINLVGAPSIIRVGDGTTAGAGIIATIDSELAGTSQLVKSDLGTLILTGTNSYSGGTAVNGGTLQVASDANLGDAAGALSFDGGALNTTVDMTSGRAVQFGGDGTLLTDAGTTLTLTGALSGAGTLSKTGDGTLVLAGASSQSGATSVEAGRLLVNGDLSGASGATTIASGATLGGNGTIGGDVTLADGAILTPGADGTGTLTVNGNMALSSGSLLNFEFGQANIPGGSLNDLVNVGGDLLLDGTINVTVSTGGTFGPGVYRVFNYGGALTDRGLALGSLPGGSDLFVQTSVAGQVNLVNTQGLTLSFWDGNAGPRNNGQVNGGDGVWRVGGGANRWTESSGMVNADYTQDSFAIFMGDPGMVSVDNVGGDVRAIGMQFASDGYVIAGGPLTLSAARSIIQVGDSSAAGAGYTARIDAELTGAAQLVKSDLGTLILTGTNSYSGGTAVNGGTLQVA
ncbi:beta strand repeat-containing protein, partial [Sphingobium cloacae]